MITFTVAVVDQRPGESRNKAIARRLAGEFGQLGLSKSEVARRIGMTQAALSRRMNDDVEFGVDEVELICKTIGVSFEYITTGARRIPDTGRDLPLPWEDPSLQPFGLRSRGVAAVLFRKQTVNHHLATVAN